MRRGPLSALAAALLLAALPGCKGRRPAAPILTWHEIGPDGASQAGDPDGWRVPQSLFLAQLDALGGAGFATIPLALLVDHQASGAALPPKPLVLTFDDGTEDHFLRVLPALRAHRMTATFFLVAGRIGADEAHRFVEHTPAGDKRWLIWPEVRALREAGMELGAHGLTHARLTELTDEAALDELVQSRRLIGAALGAPPDLLAWPYNALRSRHLALAKQAGYRAAVAGVAHGNDGLFSLYRTPITAGTTPGDLLEALR
jgi:peptidoglycan/xylan/chitin deacetylase (PgdA/CDA1 family)